MGSQCNGRTERTQSLKVWILCLESESSGFRGHSWQCCWWELCSGFIPNSSGVFLGSKWCAEICTLKNIGLPLLFWRKSSSHMQDLWLGNSLYLGPLKAFLCLCMQCGFYMKNELVDLRDRTMNRALALCMANQGSIPGSPRGPLRSEPGITLRFLGMSPKQKQQNKPGGPWNGV